MKVHRSVPKKTIGKESMLTLSFLFVIILVIGYAIFMKVWQPGMPIMNKHDVIKTGRTDAGVDNSKITESGLDKAKLQLESVNNVDKLIVILPGKEDGKEKIKYRYEWFINNESNYIQFKHYYRVQEGG